MCDVINPSLSRISWLVFHDPRPMGDDARAHELAGVSQSLSACFSRLATDIGKRHPDLDLLARLAAHDAKALGDAALLADANQQQHWFQHLKETCNGCHDQFRPNDGEHRCGADSPAQ